MPSKLRSVRRAVVACLVALPLAGCDKCGDWFWLDGAAPHSCKEAPSGQ